MRTAASLEVSCGSSATSKTCSKCHVAMIPDPHCRTAMWARTVRSVCVSNAHWRSCQHNPQIGCLQNVYGTIGSRSSIATVSGWPWRAQVRSSTPAGSNGSALSATASGRDTVAATSRRELFFTGIGGAAALAASEAPARAAVPQQAPKPQQPPAPAGANGNGSCSQRGAAAARDPSINRGCATDPSVRKQLQLQGLLPPRQGSQAVEVLRTKEALAQASSPMAKYRQLMMLRETDASTFYALLQQDVEELLPIVYTPVVGDACLQWGTLIPRPTGLYISALDAGNVDAVVANWPAKQVRLAVITDGERILGLGDLGCHGQGIPVGKTVVYGACGVDPSWLLPITVDVGCNTDAVRDDPLYVGLPQQRIRGEKYFALMDEVVEALQRRYGPSIIIHWEDVAASNAFQLLQSLQQKGTPTFNDDIQCTAAVTLAAVLGALRMPGVTPLQRQRFLFYGAGQANLGLARLLVQALRRAGVSEQKARERIWMVDSKGLIVKNRTDLSPAKAEFAQDMRLLSSTSGVGPSGSYQRLENVVAAVQPTALIGAAAVGGAFKQAVVEALVQSITKQEGPYARPLLFALSNPTNRAEVTFANAHEWSKGRVVFASGTAFPPLQATDGRKLTPAQANNAFVFPGIGLGCIASGAQQVDDDMLLAAAVAVGALVSADDLEQERILPSVSRLREAATAVAASVASVAIANRNSSVSIDSTRCLAALEKADVVPTAAGKQVQRPVDGGQSRALDCVKRLMYTA